MAIWGLADLFLSSRNNFPEDFFFCILGLLTYFCGPPREEIYEG